MPIVMRRWLLIAAVVSLMVPRSAHAASWIFFRHKDVQARAAQLSPRALERRQRARGDRGFDERDLDVSPGFIDSVRATGARVRVVSRWLNAVSVTADAQTLAAIAKLPHVAAVKPVARRLRARVDQYKVPYGGGSGMYGQSFAQLDMLGVPAMHDCGLSGDGVVVAVLDTGFTLGHEALSHLDLLAEHDFIHEDNVTANEAGDLPNQHNHGTEVLSALAGKAPGMFMGVAPDVTVILAKTEEMSFEQPIEEDWFVAGIEWVEALGADLATASLGYIDWYVPADLDGQTAVTTIAANIAMQNGLIMITAAGNWGPEPTTIGAPADADELIAVGAVDLLGVVTDFSSRGPTFDGRIKPDVSALGQETLLIDPSTTNQYQLGNGTSFATPLVAGVAALLKQAYPKLTPAEMHALLTTTASQASMPDNAMGYGIVHGYDAAGLYCTCHDLDADGEFDIACGGLDCDDEEASVHPGALERCNGLDDDCDGALVRGEDDADGDGALGCNDDCNDNDANVNPSATELCDDGIDGDCNGISDADEPACQPEPTPPEAPPPLETEVGCGCRVDDGAPHFGAWLWLAAALAARRRRR